MPKLWNLSLKRRAEKSANLTKSDNTGQRPERGTFDDAINKLPMPFKSKVSVGLALTIGEGQIVIDISVGFVVFFIRGRNL